MRFQNQKRSQAAMEFLMTYGWAILVVLAAIAALAYFGILSPEKFLPEKCVISTGSGIFCDEFSASASADTITFRIKNILTDDVSISSITTDNPVCSYTGPAIISADSTADFTLSCSAGLNSGDKVKANIKIPYTVGAAGLSKSTSGSLTTVVP